MEPVRFCFLFFRITSNTDREEYTIEEKPTCFATFDSFKILFVIFNGYRLRKTQGRRASRGSRTSRSSSSTRASARRRSSLPALRECGGLAALELSSCTTQDHTRTVELYCRRLRKPRLKISRNRRRTLQPSLLKRRFKDGISELASTDAHYCQRRAA